MDCLHFHLLLQLLLGTTRSGGTPRSWPTWRKAAKKCSTDSTGTKQRVMARRWRWSKEKQVRWQMHGRREIKRMGMVDRSAVGTRASWKAQQGGYKGCEGRDKVESPEDYGLVAEFGKVSSFLMRTMVFALKEHYIWVFWEFIAICIPAVCIFGFFFLVRLYLCYALAPGNRVY